MNAIELRKARKQLGLSLSEMAVLLGYAPDRTTAHKLEIGGRTIKPAQVRLVRAYLAGYRPPDWPVRSDAHPKTTPRSRAFKAEIRSDAR